MGYYVVFLGMQYRNDLTMSRILDGEGYDDNQMLAIKIAVSLPYMADQSDFQRVDGKFKHRGESYRLVKQKYAKDTLTILCVRDHENERISEALSNYVKTFIDNGSDSDESLKITVTFIKDFLPQMFSLLTVTPGWQSELTANIFVDHLESMFTSLVVHPPEHA
jgi:hypothetical protein